MKSKLLHVGIALVICTASLVGNALWYWKVSDMSVVMANLESKIQEKKMASENISTAKTALARFENSEALITNYFVPEEGIVPFINELETRGRSLGAAVTVASVSSKGVTGQSEFALSLKVAGTFDAVMRTVGVIEYAPYAVTISKLSLDEDEKNTWRATIELTVGSVPTVGTTPSSTTPPR